MNVATITRVSKRDIQRTISSALDAELGSLADGVTKKTSDVERSVRQSVLDEHGAETVVHSLLEQLVHARCKSYISARSIGSVLAEQTNLFDDDVLDALIEIDGVSQKFGDGNLQAVEQWESRVVSNHAAVSEAFARNIKVSTAVKKKLKSDPQLTVREIWGDLKSA